MDGERYQLAAEDQHSFHLEAGRAHIEANVNRSTQMQWAVSDSIWCVEPYSWNLVRKNDNENFALLRIAPLWRPEEK